MVDVFDSGVGAATGLFDKGVTELVVERINELGFVGKSRDGREVGTASGFFLQDLHLSNLSDLAGIGARRGQQEHWPRFRRARVSEGGGSAPLSR